MVILWNDAYLRGEVADDVMLPLLPLLLSFIFRSSPLDNHHQQQPAPPLV
jgi:hypothetical protein